MEEKAAASWRQRNEFSGNNLCFVRHLYDSCDIGIVVSYRSFFFLSSVPSYCSPPNQSSRKVRKGREKGKRTGCMEKKRIKKKRDAVSNSINLQARKPKNIVMLLEIPINSPWR